MFAVFRRVLLLVALLLSLLAPAAGEGALFLHAPGEIQAGSELQISFSAYPQAENYLMTVSADGREYAYEWLGEGATSAVWPALLPAGEYTLTVAAYNERWEEPWPQESISFLVSGDLAAGPSAVPETDSVPQYESLSFTVQAPGASRVLGCVGKLGTIVYADVVDGAATLSLPMNRNGEVAAYFSAFSGGLWTGYGEPVSLYVIGQEKLDAAEITVPQTVSLSDASLDVLWTAVEHAEEYYVQLDHEESGDGYFWRLPADQLSLSVDMGQLAEGTWRVRVRPLAENYESVNNHAWVTIAPGSDAAALPPAPAVTHGATQLLANLEYIEFQVDTRDALALEMDRGGSVRALPVDGDTYYGRLSFSEDTTLAFRVQRADGWSAWTDPLEIRVVYIGQLAPLEVSMKETFRAGESVDIAWPLSEDMTRYSLSLLRWEDDGWRYMEYWDAPGDSLGTYVPVSLCAGKYRLEIRPQADGWDASQAQTDLSFTVEGALAAGPVLTADSYEIPRRSPVTFYLEMEGAEKFRIASNESVVEINAQDGAAAYTEEGFTWETVQRCSASAYVNGAWTAYGPEIEITVTERVLAAAVLPDLQTGQAGTDVYLTWEEAPGAARYQAAIWDGENLIEYLPTEQAADGRWYIPAGKIAQGAYTIRIAAYGDVSYGYSNPGQLVISAPDADSAYDMFAYKSDGTANLFEYLGEMDGGDLTIPDTYQGYIPVYIGKNFLPAGSSVARLTLPASIQAIAEGAFDGVAIGTICAPTGSFAEMYARFRGLAFEPTDSGSASVALSWSEPLLVNSETTLSFACEGANTVRLLIGDNEHQDVAHIEETNAGFAADTVFTTPGSHLLRAEARIGGEWFSSPVYEVQVVSYGEMPAAANLSAAQAAVEPGTALSVCWNAGENGETYSWNLASPVEDEYAAAMIALQEEIAWTPAENACAALPWDALLDPGEYTFTVRTNPAPGYEPSYASCALTVASTTEVDFNADHGAFIAYNGPERVYTVPESIDGVPVTAIADRAFLDKGMVSVILPDTVQSIGYRAFEGNENMKSIALPDSLSSIGAYAFAGCKSLERLEIPEGVQAIEHHTFEWCQSLSELVLPSSLRSISYGVFSHCDSLKTLYLPANMTSIDPSIAYSDVTLYCPAESLTQETCQAAGVSVHLYTAE